MREQPVIRHADAETLGYPGKHPAHNQTTPTPIKKRRNGAGVKNDHPYRGWPANSAVATVNLNLFVHQKCFHIIFQNPRGRLVNLKGRL
jgi:hypothetical protein